MCGGGQMSYRRLPLVLGRALAAPVFGRLTFVPFVVPSSSITVPYVKNRFESSSTYKSPACTAKQIINQQGLHNYSDVRGVKAYRGSSVVINRDGWHIVAGIGNASYLPLPSLFVPLCRSLNLILDSMSKC
jgi:hypothetical protein